MYFENIVVFGIFTRFYQYLKIRNVCLISIFKVPCRIKWASKLRVDTTMLQVGCLDLIKEKYNVTITAQSQFHQNQLYRVLWKMIDPKHWIVCGKYGVRFVFKRLQKQSFGGVL